MKKLIIILFSFITPIFNSGCLLEPDKEFVTDTLVVNVHDTTKIHDTTTIYKDTLFFHDTVRSTIIKKDTLWRHDTVRTTITKRDTLWKHDTIKTFATNTISTVLPGVWSGIVQGKQVTLSIVAGNSSSPWDYTYTANIGSSAYDGKIETFSNNIAKCVYMYGPGMIGEDANWLISISNNIMTLQQTGYPMFPTMEAFTLNRVN